MTFLHWLPVFVYALLLWVFARTLLPGRKPLVSVFAELARGELEPRVAHYTRRVTQLWTLVFVALLLEMILLAAVAHTETWFFINLLNNLFVGLVFVAEYGFRRYYLADLPHPTFSEYLRFLRQTRWRALVGR